MKELKLKWGRNWVGCGRRQVVRVQQGEFTLIVCHFFSSIQIVLHRNWVNSSHSVPSYHSLYFHTGMMKKLKCKVKGGHTFPPLTPLKNTQPHPTEVSSDGESREDCVPSTQHFVLQLEIATQEALPQADSCLVTARGRQPLCVVLMRT